MTTKAKYGSTRDEVAEFFLANNKTTHTSANIADDLGANTKTVRNVLCSLVNDAAIQKTKTGYKTRSIRTLCAIAA